MRKTICLLAFLLVTCLVKAQDEPSKPENIFAFALSSTAPTDAGLSMPGDTVKRKRALEVFNKLVAARGDFRQAIPDFVMTNNEHMVAWMNYDRLEIGIEEKAFDVCMSFGKDADAALASLLGHELSHYYEKHTWRRNFVNQYQDMKIGALLGNMTRADTVLNETQADYVGGFLAFSAGYPVFDKGADLTAALYKAYGLPDSIYSYPSLDERKELNLRSAKVLDKLVNVYETANLLTIVGKYKEAAMYYQYVLQDYQSPKMFNNAGILTLMVAIGQGEKYALPIEIDMGSIDSRGDPDENVRTKLLREAIRHFDAAINLDPNYAPAYLNKACAFVAMNDLVRARFYAEVEVPAAVKRASNYKKANVDARVVLGILEWVAGDSTKADQLFRELVEKDSSNIAQQNLRRLHKEKAPPPPEPPISFMSETIDDIDLNMEASELLVDYKNRIGVGPGMTFYQNLKTGANSKLLKAKYVNDGKEVNTYFLRTKPGYTGKTGRRIEVGASSADVFKAYGTPLQTMETTTGQLWLFNDTIFFFEGTSSLKVSGWALWLVE